jgi:hypothetical protein
MGIIEDGLGAVDSAFNTISSSIGNLSTTEIAVGTAAAGALAGGSVVGLLSSSTSKSTKKRKNKKPKKITHTKRGWSADRKRRSKQKWEVAYQKKKKKSKKKTRKTKKSHSKRHGRIHYAKKTGQPYILLRSGRAKFIKGKRRKN